MSSQETDPAKGGSENLDGTDGAPVSVQDTRMRRIIEAFDASLDQPEDARKAWLDQHFPDDAAAIEEVLALIAADNMAPSVMPTELAGTNGSTMLVAPQRIGAYRLENIIGSGGMGEVWRGVRDDGLFDQEVAIKLMRPSRYPSESLKFFDTERRALARLNHRHIARLFDGGVTENGIPWFIMELVDGLPLHVYAAGRRPSIPASIELMAKIAEAVQYAHEQLVVHADLKPSNVLITPLGEPCLVDFGIASLAATAAEDKEVLAFPSTPAYASPARLEGQSPTPSDDIFSLGLMTHGLVLGAWPQGPVSGALSSTGRADLDAVIAKACAVAPEDRYRTAESLADDLRAILEHRPTSLQAGDWRQQIRLLAKRRPRAIGSAVAVAIGAIAAFILITGLYLNANHERHRAEARFNDVRRLAGYVITDFHDDLLKLPGSTALRERNAAVGWEYLTHLSKDEGLNDEVKADIAVGFGRLGNAQATSGGNGTGKVKDGDWALAQSEAILRSLVTKYPNRDDFKRDLARTLVSRSGVILGAHHDQAGADAALKEAFTLYDEVLKHNPKDLEAAYWRWNASLGQADYFFAQNKLSELKALMLSDQARFGSLPVPEKYWSTRVILDGATENYLGDADYYLVNPEAGIDHYKRAQSAVAKARAAGLVDVRATLREAYYDYQIASSYEDTKRPRLAIAWARKGEALLLPVTTFEKSAMAEHTLDILVMMQGLALSDMKQYEAAAAQEDRTIERRRQILASQPGDSDNHVNLAHALADQSGYYSQANNVKKACLTAREALDMFTYLQGHGGLAKRYTSGDIPTLTAYLPKCPVAK